MKRALCHCAVARWAKLDKGKRKGSRSGEGNAFWQVIWNYGKLNVTPQRDPLWRDHINKERKRMGVDMVTYTNHPIRARWWFWHVLATWSDRIKKKKKTGITSEALNDNLGITSSLFVDNIIKTNRFILYLKLLIGHSQSFQIFTHYIA